MFEPRAKEGFHNVCELIQGTLLEKVRVDEEYSFFEPRVYGPPTPAYLATAPTLTLRIANRPETPEST